MKTISINEETVRGILEKIRGITVCTVGDVCLDLYLYADMKLSLLSRETPHHPLPIVKETATPGGGGNVMNNIRALGVNRLLPVSLIGDDWRGFLLTQYLEENGFDTSRILKSSRYLTTCFCKPMRMGISDVVYEDPRLDFENRSPMTEEDEDRVLAAFDEAAEQADILAVSDQVRCGVITPRIRERILEWAKKKPVVMDSRENSCLFPGVIAKPNEVEAAFAIGRDIRGLDLSTEELAEIGAALREKIQSPVIVTIGERGALWCDADGVTLAPTRKAAPPVDIVGAGDTFLSAFCCAYAAGASGPEATAFANLASGVTVKKIGTTGTASPEEILERFRENAGGNSR